MKSTTQGIATGVPDMCNAWSATRASRGRLGDLGDIADGRGYTETALASGQVIGVQDGLPWETGAVGPTVNPALFDDEGQIAADRPVLM